ncbi:hypothetical protein EVAR_45429_1 [Eumeta japonica]|uniref:Uncharacterized protein n=1 Tax=Eumeta variegata TaxID=151549 RepID=A0A4C1ZIX2_EUMVA|nr:hypothetical protein EVAR_45429_1 [Eumeta japonica]
MWRCVAMRKRLCDSLLTRFDGAVYYSIHFDYIYHCIAWRPVVTASIAMPTIRFTLRLYLCFISKVLCETSSGIRLLVLILGPLAVACGFGRMGRALSSFIPTDHNVNRNPGLDSAFGSVSCRALDFYFGLVIDMGSALFLSRSTVDLHVAVRMLFSTCASTAGAAVAV